jgi:hypothetical protein
MKTTLLIALGLLLPCARPASAANGASFSEIRTNSGKVYVNCRVYKTQPVGVVIAFENGGAKVRFADLSPEWRATLGYDPEKEAAYEKERAEKKRKEQEEREELAKQRVEMARIQVAAYEAEAARYRFMSMQGGYDGYDGSGGYPYPYGYPYVGGYPYFGSYSWGYAYDNAAYYPGYGYGAGPTSNCYGYGGLTNSLYPYNRGYNVGTTGYPYNYGVGIGTFGYGNSYGSGYGYGYGLGVCRPGAATRCGVTSPAPCRTNWNGNHGWNGNGGWQGNSFNGHFNAGSRAFCGTPSFSGFGRPACNIPTPCRVPVATASFGRFTPSTANCVRRR